MPDRLLEHMPDRPATISPTLERAAADLETALSAREAEWPARGPGWERLTACLGTFADRVLERLTPVAGPVDGADRPDDTPIVIGGPMKSGTTLLTSLLDGHPELVVLPGDTWMRSWLGGGRHPPVDPGATVRFWLQRVIVPTGQRPFWLLGREPEAYVEFSAAVEDARRRLAPGGLASFLAGPAALGRVCGRGEPRRFVEKTPGNERHVEAILAGFPGAAFVHVLRHPLAIAAALKRLAGSRGWPWDIAACARELRESFESAARWSNALGPRRYHVVRYESLVEQPEAQMRALAADLGLSFHASLLLPTVFGRPASSNSMFEHRRVRGVLADDRDPEQRWRSTLGEDEIAAARDIAAPAASPFGYEL